MRYPKIHKQLSRQRIVRAAARAFNRLGFDGVGIADIMKDAGLTQGAFSAHFSSKDELISEAIDDAFRNLFVEQDWKDRSLEEMISNYLSVVHRDGPENGCPACCLTADVSRLPRRMRETFLVHLYEMLNSIESRLPTNVRGSNRKEVAMSLFALLLGSIQLSRVSRGTALSEAMIDAANKAVNSLIGTQAGSKRRSGLVKKTGFTR
jgi:TetR/AcrR family transcriptional regulator, transcriptional repressor for nem operon